MAALNVEREPKEFGKGYPRDLSTPIAANTKILKGAAVCKNAAGYAVNASTATGLQSLGVAKKTYDNTGGAAAAFDVETKLGSYDFANSAAADEITIADKLNDVYWVDNQTVAKTSATSTRSVAGKVSHIEGGRVFVFISGGL